MSSFLFLGCATSYVVHHATSVWSSLMTINGMKTVIIYSLETIYQTLINLEANFQGNEVIDDVRYHKIPKISPGAYIFQRPFLRGLFLEGLIYGGKFAFQNRFS